MISKTIIHLMSGGLDSTTMLYELHSKGHNIHCLMFDYKQKHVQELTFAKLHCHRLAVLFTVKELPDLSGLTDENWIVPNRNAIFLSMGVNLAVRAKASTITIGCNADDRDSFPDCRKEFIDSMNQSCKAAGYDIEICAPYLNKHKWEIGGIARNLHIPSHEIWTCYRGGAKPCGKCPACEKLTLAML